MSDEELRQQKCAACEGGTKPLQRGDAQPLLDQLNSDWSIADDDRRIERVFKFKNYYHTIEFVNALAWIANCEGHHPDLEVSYNRCAVQFSTHSIGGLSRNDFICAAKTDALFD